MEKMMMTRGNGTSSGIRLAFAALAVSFLATLSPADATAQDFEWRGELDRGDAVEVRGINGQIEAVATTGNRVTVTAEMREGREGSVDDVSIEVVEHGNGVTICAMYPTKAGKRESRCAPGDSHLSNHDNDTRVDFRIEVPSGVNLVAGTVNGDVNVQRVAGDVRASTVNGDVNVESGGNVQGSTVNGSIRATMGADLRSDLDFNTVNGSVTVALPAGSNAEVEASTVNGSMSSDFPLTVQGRFSNRRMRGTIGDGGHRLRLETVNGGIEIRRS